MRHSAISPPNDLTEDWKNLALLYSFPKMEDNPEPTYKININVNTDFLSDYFKSITSIELLKEKYFNSLNTEYRVENVFEVKNFLMKCEIELFEILLDATKVLHDYFISRIYLSLSLLSDPEAPGYESLRVSIGTKLPVDDAMKCLNEFDEMWWLKAMDETDGNLSFDIELI